MTFILTVKDKMNYIPDLILRTLERVEGLRNDPGQGLKIARNSKKSVCFKLVVSP